MRSAASLVVLAALAGCALLPRPLPPEVVGVRVGVVDARMPEVRLAVDVVVRNPNARDLAVEALEGTLSLDGEDAGHARLVRAVTLPARGEASLPLDIRSDAARLVARFGAALRAARPIEYAVRGTLTLADGTVVPFRRGGRLPEGRTP